MAAATNEKPQQDWYWCDWCKDYFYGSAALAHKGQRCHAHDEDNPWANR